MARVIKIRVTKEIEEIHTCPVTDEEYEEMLEAREIAESNYWDRRIDEARGN